MKKRSILRRWFGAIGLAVALAYGGAVGLTGSPGLDHPAAAQQRSADIKVGQLPSIALQGEGGTKSVGDFWRDVRQGRAGYVPIPDKQANILIQSQGEDWRSVRNGPLSTYGAWLVLGIIALLALFFALRGRIRLESGFSGRTIERFNAIERANHWMTATAFIILAITGLNMLYGRYILLPLFGPEVFATLTNWGKWAHDFTAFAFILGLVVMFVMWVKDNILDRYDLEWIAKGGGMFTSGVHPPARKFNFGQKVVFWIVILGGGSLAFSGVALLFPFAITPWSETFAVLNIFGFDLPTNLRPIQEMQLSQVWHAILGLVLTAVIIAHIYIGTIGMEGAFDAMGTGQVDENWAREHHSVWVAELGQAAPAGGHAAQQPQKA